MTEKYAIVAAKTSNNNLEVIDFELSYDVAMMQAKIYAQAKDVEHIYVWKVDKEIRI